ncbi:probable E3 ubiquitin-protein ligase XBOS33 at N-terminal half [Coccomyxa sp. Obi]|nr:probable E3 ubiquitin-protein ligase XBOS33 at N-terminal half [Coccomyxa sp. Obi]
MGAAISCVSPGGQSLLSAGTRGLSDNVREVLEVRPELASYTFFNHQYNVMHHAAEHGHVEVLKAVVEVLQSSAAQIAGGDTSGDLKEPSITVFTWGRFVKDVMNARTLSGKTPLMLACEHGRLDCVEYLLDQGADVFAVDKHQRRSAIHYAVAGGHVDVLKMLLSDDAKVHTEDGQVPLRDVRIHDMSGQCRYVDSRAENGLTALHMAAALGHLACVQALLTAGASMMVRTVDLDMHSSLQSPAGSTPLHLAAQRGHIAILQAMLQAHADALGTWGGGVRAADGQVARRAWEGDGRIDLRSVTNSLRQLPYHVAWQRGFRQAATVLNPTIAIDIALETARDLEDGYGPQKLATLAAYALRRNLLDWLETFKVEKLCAERMRSRAEHFKKHACTEAKAASPFGASPEVPVSQSGASRASETPSPPTVPLIRLPRRSCSATTLGHVVEHEDEGRASTGSQPDIIPDPQAVPDGGPESTDAGAATQYKSQESPAASRDPSSSGKRVGFVAEADPEAAPSEASSSGPKTAPPQPAEDTHRPTRSPFERAALAPFTPADGSSSKADSIAGGSERPATWTGDGSEQKPSPEGPPLRAKSASVPFLRRRSPGLLTSTMSERLQELERAVTVDPLEGSSDGDKPEEAPASRRTSSASVVRKSSITIRRTLSSFKRGRSDASQRVVGEHTRAASITGFEPELARDDDDCGICLEAELDVAINGCSHKLCVDCAIRLCEINKKPPLCPFCRHFIDGFNTLRTAKPSA